MIRSVIALIVGVSIASATPTITKGPYTYRLGHSNIQMIWETAASAVVKIGWGTVSHAGNTGCGGNPCSGDYANSATGTLSSTIQRWYLSALLSGQQYYWVACAYDGAQTCSTEQSFTTLALPSPHPQAPTAPATVDVTMPSCANGQLHCVASVPVTQTVGSDCDHATTGLVAKWTSAAWGDTIIIPTTTVCRGIYSLPPKVGWDSVKQMVITSDQAGSLPASGTRIGPANVANMASFVQSSYGHTASLTATGLVPGSYAWDSSSSTPAWAMYKADSVATATITTATSTGTSSQYSANIVTSAPLGVLPVVGQMCSVAGATTPVKLNGSCVFTSVTDASHFAIATRSSYVNSVTAYTGTATITMYDFGSLVTVASYLGTEPTDPCTIGDWAYSDKQPDGVTPLIGRNAIGSYTDQRYSSARVFLCTATNTWKHHYVIYNTGPTHVNPTDAMLDLSQVHDVRLIGLSFSHDPIPPDPLLLRSGAANETQSGATPSHFLNSHYSSYHIVIDRCMFRVNSPAKSNVMVYMDGNYVAMVDSYLKDEVGVYFATQDAGGYSENLAGDKISIAFGGPKLYQNNYLEGYGITIHHNDQGAGTGLGIHDISVVQNYFYRDLTKIYWYSGWDGTTPYIPLRQLLEFKRGLRARIDGNIFEGNFRNVAQGASLAMTNVADGWANNNRCDITYVGGSGVCTYQYAIPVLAQVGDLVTFLDGKIWTVTATSPTAFAIAGLPAGYDSTWQGYVVITSTQEGIADYTITNNTFNQVPNIINNYSIFDVNLAGNSNGFYPVFEDRVLIQNNIFSNYGPGGLTVPAAQNWQTSGADGYMHLVDWGPVDDWLINHNTFYNFTFNAAPYNANATYIYHNVPAQSSEGWTYRNNMSWHPNALQQGNNASGGVTGNAYFDTLFSGTNPFNFNNNATVRTGGNPGGYNSPNTWLAYTGQSPIFADVNTLDFTLTSLYRAADTCYTTPGDCTSPAGVDEGVDMPALLAAQANACADLAFSPTSASAAGAGDSGTFDATVTDSSCDRAVTSSAGWLTCTANCTGTGSVSGIAWTAAANAGSARSATLSAAGAVFTVNQATAPVPGVSSQTRGMTSTSGMTTMR